MSPPEKKYIHHFIASCAQNERINTYSPLIQGITVKTVKNDEHSERIVVARILSGGLADTFGEN